MAHALTLPILGGLAVAGAALGVHLGNSSISEIDPNLFARPATRFHSDLVPSPPPMDGYVARADGPETIGLGSGCIGCYPEEYFPVQDPSIERLSSASAAFEEPQPLPAYEQPSEELASRPAALERIERYARFRIAAEQEAAAPASAPEPTQAAAESEATAIQGDEAAASD